MSARFKEIVGVVDNVLMFEKESFEILMTDHKNSFTIEKAVKLNLKDYNDSKSVSILKVSKDGKSALVLSDHLTYQSNVPFQSIMLPTRVSFISVT